jgi:hypothetical protein
MNTVSETAKNRVLDQAIAHVGLSSLIFRGNPMGTFIGALDRESIEAVGSGKPRRRKPTLSWKLAVDRFRSDFGAAFAPIVISGVDKAARASAITKRQQRANETRLSDIRLSMRVTSGAPITSADEE